MSCLLVSLYSFPLFFSLFLLPFPLLTVGKSFDNPIHCAKFYTTTGVGADTYAGFDIRALTDRVDNRLV
jgi:hypothetical protein